MRNLLSNKADFVPKSPLAAKGPLYNNLTSSEYSIPRFPSGFVLNESPQREGVDR